jgi:hypothetical protein
MAIFTGAIYNNLTLLSIVRTVLYRSSSPPSLQREMGRRRKGEKFRDM